MPPDYQLATSHPPLTSPAATRANRGPRGAAGFADGRAAAEKAEAVQRVRAARTVAEHSLNAEDRGVLLSMLGIAGPEPVAQVESPLPGVDSPWSSQGAHR
ncbi:hypothetical protein [Actinokineospora diospyrosa]|uniref:Uncharacterized protein n=1 Tax=Actinokineospora diospyrosa TaxID=103728 RepID=A0ABT1IJ07_9PSEU|nr:hypothetical protein [Actinokineospora diospyrosa]MCP2272539.1 hypothetical protein [Actinokineospora diospyrosa]